MAIDVKTIACPQCGSTDVEMSSDTQGTCKSCGAQFVVQPQIDTQNVYNETHIHYDGPEPVSQENTCTKTEIIPEFTKEQFIRKAWINLAKEDAPIDAFNANFGEVNQIDHEVLIDSVSVDMSYQASIGYDRQEPYIAYEDYYEDEPYYDNNGNRKTRRVKKQRQVTKYKTVTDWSPLRGDHHDSSIAIVENTPGQFLDEGLFIGSFRHMSPESLSDIDEERSAKMVVTETAHESAMSEHRSALYRSLLRTLPGDHYKDVDYNITDITDSSTSLYIAQEYEATITYNGKSYTKRTFPFGIMEVGGDHIENDDSLSVNTGKMRDQIPNMVWDKTKKISIMTIGLLALSILVSLLIPVTAIVVIAFIAALAAFIYNTVSVKRTTKEVTGNVDEEVANFTSNYKQKQREMLNNKLRSLGFEPVSSAEL